jgi:CheY-like chemotaxis protein
MLSAAMARLLVVEDSTNLAALIAAAAGSRGHSARTAKDGTAALTALGRETFDVAVVDLMLSDMSGLDVLEQLYTRGVPCVAVSNARSDPGLHDASLARGAQAYFEKPFSMGALLQAVETLTDVPVILATNEDAALPEAEEGEELLEIDDEFAALAAQAASQEAAQSNGAVGAIEPGTIPRLLLELARNREWGALRLQAGELAMGIHIEAGQPVQVDPLPEGMAMAEMIYPTFFWNQGQYSLVRAEAPPSLPALPPGVRPWDFVFNGLLQPQPLEWLQVSLPLERRLQATEQAAYAQHQLTLTPDQAAVLAQVDGSKSVGDLLLLSELDEAEGLTLLLAFAHLGLVEMRVEDTKRSRISFGL